jgi:hypothetical protein
VQDAIQPLENFHEWYWHERDLTRIGLVGVGSYSGKIQEARYETYDKEADLDDLKMTKHPHRKGHGERAWYGDILIPANTSYLLLSEASLARLAHMTGHLEIAHHCKMRLKKEFVRCANICGTRTKGAFWRFSVTP